MITVVLPGEPVAQGRPRAFKTPAGFIRTYDPAKSRNWKATAQEHMRSAMGDRPPLAGPCACEITAVFTCPKSEWRKREPLGRRPHAKRPDGENVAKAVLDAATGVLWLDDAQVARLLVVKIIGAQGEAPSVEVAVRELVEQPHPAAQTIQPKLFVETEGARP